MKRKLEADLARLSSENEELISEFRAADERAKKAVTDVSHWTYIKTTDTSDWIVHSCMCLCPGNTTVRGASAGAGKELSPGEGQEEPGAEPQRPHTEAGGS